MAESLAAEDFLSHSTAWPNPFATMPAIIAPIAFAGDVTLNSMLQCGKHL